MALESVETYDALFHIFLDYPLPCLGYWKVSRHMMHSSTAYSIFYLLTY